jgi:glycosyltransferase involved in cell wall biosynthesis
VRIGLDANPVFQTRGGIGQYAARLADGMSAASPGDEFFLYYWGNEKNLGEEWLLRENIVIRNVASRRSFASAVSKDNVDIYHGTNFRLRARGRTGSIITIHDLALKIFPHLRHRWFGDWLGHIKTSRDARLSDRVITDSDATARDVMRHIGISRRKLRVIHLAAGTEFRPVDDPRVIASLLSRIGMKHPRYILFSGTLEPRKNVPVLLRAYLALRADFPDTGLVLAGMPGWKSANITDFIRMNGLAEDVRITGYLALHDLAALYSGASVFVLPSLYEGFGLPPLEAMACGAPVIVSNGGSLPEVVGDAAIVLSPDDAEGFRREIARVLASPGLARELKEKGFRRAAGFSWDRTAAETLKVYREVAG